MGSLGMPVEHKTILGLGISRQNTQRQLLPTFLLPFRDIPRYILFAEIIANFVSVFLVADQTDAKNKTSLTREIRLTERVYVFFYGLLPSPIRIDVIVMMD